MWALRSIHRQDRKNSPAVLPYASTWGRYPCAFDVPKTPRRKGKLNPTFAAGTAEGQRRGRAILNAFRSAYREALHKWRHGLACVFPAGTFWLARFARVACAPLETACPPLDTG